MSRLCDEYEVLYKRGKIDKELPSHILDNLSPDKPLRPYQEKAFAYYLDYMQSPPSNPIHLLFQMATGSGKTLMMAGLICDLYKRGYRHFLFFVNSKNIIEKTKDNFLNSFSRKYLFNPNMIIDGQKVDIKEVSNFADADPDVINIHFTTIQGLHDNLNNSKENAVTYADFEDKQIVLISDEAHHINASTKKNMAVDDSNEQSWEATVFRILNTHQDNLLLEFTATLDLENPFIRQKYDNKIFFKYSLLEFRQDKYSKDVELLQVDREPLERSLGAVILSQYRLKLASFNRVHLKPVILMKSKTVKDSEAFEQAFYALIEKLSGDDLKTFHNQIKDSVLQDAFSSLLYDYSYDDLAREVKGDFGREKCVSVNSQNDSEEKQILINNLEDYHNQIRVVFAVDKLNEGWDVLNLFDIVRLYDTRDSKGGKIGKTTNAEAQLIGRGARYYPFTIPLVDLPREKRKFDGQFHNDLRMLEVLYYHCSHNPKYIHEIKTALKQMGLLPDEQKTVTVKLKDSFKATDLYQRGYIFSNKQVKNKREDILSFEDYRIPVDFTFDGFKMGNTASYSAFDEEKKDIQLVSTIHKIFALKDFDADIIRHAIDTVPFYTFKNISKHFPRLDSVSLFIALRDYLSKITVGVKILEEAQTLTQEEQLQTVQFVLGQVKEQIEKKSFDYKGTKEFYPDLIKEVFKDKTIKVQTDQNSDKQTGKAWDKVLWGFGLDTQDWFAFNDNHGTSEEKNLIRFIHAHRHEIQNVYSDFYLIRNEGDLKLYNFEDGKGFMPDFVLFLRKHNENTFETLQLFIEPKGDHLLDVDAWKEAFLKEISYKQDFGGGSSYRIEGLSFYNEKRKREFEGEFRKKF